MIRRTVHEWTRIAYGTGETQIPEPQADRIVAEAQASALSGHNGQEVLEHGRMGLRARGVVGMIATHGCQLEILPKIESDDDDTTLRHRLIHMLAVARDIRIHTGAMTQLAWQRDTVLEQLIRLYCSKLTDAVRKGLPQQYILHEEDLPVLRGRLDVTRQFSTLIASPQKLACQFDVRSPDIALNQVMLATISKLSRLAQAPDNQRTLRELRFAYADITEVFRNALRWDLIALDRTNTRWRDLLSLARLFLNDRHQQTGAGPVDGYSLLFEMSALFEEYVAKLLTRALAGTDLTVAIQGGHRACLFDGEMGRFQTRPDLIVRDDSGIVLIIDTKWKRLEPTADANWGVNQADVYQLMAYNRLYNCRHVVLLYPHHSTLPPTQIQKRYSIEMPNAQENLFITTLDLTGSTRKQESELKCLVEAILSR